MDVSAPNCLLCLTINKPWFCWTAFVSLLANPNSLTLHLSSHAWLGLWVTLLSCEELHSHGHCQRNVGVCVHHGILNKVGTKTYKFFVFKKMGHA